MADRVKITIPGKPEYIAMVRLAVGAIADTSGFNVEEIEDIKTAVGQACKNISCHGKEGLTTEYTLECVLDDDTLEIYVTDTGSMNCGDGLSMQCVDCPNEGDIGVYLINTLMSEVELIDNPGCKKTIRMVKRK